MQHCTCHVSDNQVAINSLQILVVLSGGCSAQSLCDHDPVHCTGMMPQLNRMHLCWCHKTAVLHCMHEEPRSSPVISLWQVGQAGMRRLFEYYSWHHGMILLSENIVSTAYFNPVSAAHGASR